MKNSQDPFDPGEIPNESLKFPRIRGNGSGSIPEMRRSVGVGHGCRAQAPCTVGFAI